MVFHFELEFWGDIEKETVGDKEGMNLFDETLEVLTCCSRESQSSCFFGFLGWPFEVY